MALFFRQEFRVDVDHLVETRSNFSAEQISAEEVGVPEPTAEPEVLQSTQRFPAIEERFGAGSSLGQNVHLKAELFDVRQDARPKHGL